MAQAFAFGRCLKRYGPQIRCSGDNRDMGAETVGLGHEQLALEARAEQSTDVLSKIQRSQNMSAIRAKDTKPELLVRRALHAAGFRFRIHRRDLPGKPDIVMPSRNVVIFVNGCFWHSHDCRYGRVTPKQNAQFWAAKRSATVVRDASNHKALRELGWAVEVIWECELRASAAALSGLITGLRRRDIT